MKEHTNPRGHCAAQNKVTLSKLGLITRDYNFVAPNGYRDFSDTFESVLTYLDEQQCDTAVFSLYSLLHKHQGMVLSILAKQRHLKCVLVEYFDDDINANKRSNTQNVLYLKTQRGWHPYSCNKRFGSLSTGKKKKVTELLSVVSTERTIGNASVLICGETNIVRYQRLGKKVVDSYQYLSLLGNTTQVILNPVHDKMMRFEMVLKRKFLSQHGRTVISLWNRGKQLKSGRYLIERQPAWSIYHDGIDLDVPIVQHGIENDINLEIGILKLTK